MFNPSTKQDRAVKSMELFVGVSQPREDYKSKDEFQEYWDLLDKRIKRKKTKSKQTPEQRAAAEKRKERSIQKYYSDPVHLLTYAIKYSQKFSPSPKKLEEMLLKKAKKDLVDQVIVKVDIDEDQMIRDYIKIFSQSGKGEQEIIIKLANKKFDRSLVTQIIREIKDSDGSLLDDFAISQKIKNLISQGKSRHEILQKLSSNSNDKYLVSQKLDEFLDDCGEDLLINKAISRYSTQNISEEKLIQRLQRRGFSYGDIRRILDQNNN